MKGDVTFNDRCTYMPPFLQITWGDLRTSGMNMFETMHVSNQIISWVELH